MSGIPQDVTTVNGEGLDLSAAVKSAAEALEVPAKEVAYKLDMSHFRSATGASRAVRSVKIIAWHDPKKAEEPARAESAPRRERDSDDDRRRDRGDRDRDEGRRRDDDRRRGRDGDRRRGRDSERRGRDSERRGRDSERRGRDGERRRDRDDRPRRRRDSGSEFKRGPEESATEASDYAAEWFSTLFTHMDVKGTVTGTGNDERVHLNVTADQAGRIIGRRGATLAAIRHLLGLAIERRFGALTIDVDIADERGEDDGESEAPRRQRRRRDEGREDREGGRERSRHNPDKLRALARRAAEKALETGKPITIKLDLNSYDRRLIHVEVAEIEGVSTRSEERGRSKVIQVIPE